MLCFKKNFVLLIAATFLYQGEVAIAGKTASNNQNDRFVSVKRKLKKASQTTAKKARSLKKRGTALVKKQRLTAKRNVGSTGKPRTTPRPKTHQKTAQEVFSKVYPASAKKAQAPQTFDINLARDLPPKGQALLKDPKVLKLLARHNIPTNRPFKATRKEIDGVLAKIKCLEIVYPQYDGTADQLLTALKAKYPNYK